MCSECAPPCQRCLSADGSLPGHAGTSVFHIWQQIVMIEQRLRWSPTPAGTKQILKHENFSRTTAATSRITSLACTEIYRLRGVLRTMFSFQPNLSFTQVDMESIVGCIWDRASWCGCPQTLESGMWDECGETDTMRLPTHTASSATSSQAEVGHEAGPFARECVHEETIDEISGVARDVR